MATTHSHDHDELLGNDLPPPAYELTDTELDRKIADAAQRSLSLQQEQIQRPALPPLDEDGFPIWSEDLFKYNETQRQLEDETRSAKLRSEYTHTGTQPSGSSGSTSTSPPSRAPVTNEFNSKKENKWWFDSSSQVIAQDEDEDGGRVNAGRPPSMSPQTQNAGSRPPPIQVQVGPRPHDILAQPQSPTSDVDEDEALAAGDPSLGRAPTYYPMGQTHPGHAQRLERHSTRGSVSSIRTMLPAFTPEPESLEGPAYEEVAQVPPRSAPQPQRQSGQWAPLNVRPQVQERVSRASMVPYASVSPPPPVPASVLAPAPPPPVSAPRPPVSAPPPHRSTAPNMYTLPAPPAATSYMPTGYNPPVAPLRPTGFDPSVAYRPAQTHRYTLAGRVGGDEGMLEAQKVLREGGAGAFYNNAVAATMQRSPAFQSPAPAPPRVIDDDGASVFSGRSAGRQSVGSGGARMSVYASNDPTPNRMSYVLPLPTGGPAYQPMGSPAYQPMGGPPYQPPPAPARECAYQPSHGAFSRPLPGAPGFAQPNMGVHMHTPNGFVAPPPPQGVAAHSGKKPGKLYKRL
ncbi:hypothetical protein B0J17DRAFT_643410 [Rhizoctonia solani]|nr:hypothetical protein B0J17DRAFT_643410 [Rhizoctonia solani]